MIVSTCDLDVTSPVYTGKYHHNAAVTDSVWISHQDSVMLFGIYHPDLIRKVLTQISKKV